ncbi:bactofilin family protein [Candidatus Palauibacter sp.]|uniref:bactofilin family protein n=1 Tax=Candidatus Palauibacter sp. TaxID=3101350 RepID=UPI003B5CB6A7
MIRDSRQAPPVREVSDVVSVIAPGMTVLGDIRCEGTVRVEGKVEGSVQASKSVVVGKKGQVVGDIETQDVVVAGSVQGTVMGASRVELQETCHIDGDIRSRRIKLDEGGQIDGRFHMSKADPAEKAAAPATASGTKGPGRSLQPKKHAAGRS